MQKKYGTSVDGYLRATRMAQGYEELARATQAECEVIVKRWDEVNIKLDKKKRRARS